MSQRKSGRVGGPERADTCRRSGRGVGGFTIIELMVVMIVITIVISILLPAIGMVRDTARATSTQGLVNNLVAAASKFSVDHKRQPGYFSWREMGSQQNEDRGLSSAENVMLDLSGGVVGTGASAGGQPPDTITINPTTNAAQDVYVDPKQIGIGKGAYFVPPPKFYVPQTFESDDSCQQFTSMPGVLGHSGPEGTESLPDLVDAWNNPILVWVEDESAVAPVNPQATPPVLLVSRRSPPPNAQQPPAKFYWASNAAFLRATALGRKGRDQTFSPSPSDPEPVHSMIADPASTAGPPHDAIRSLESVLGNPNFPWKPPTAIEHPAVPRAPFIVQSAGSDGYYFGSKDRGGRRFGNGVIDYNFTFWATGVTGGARQTDKNGNPTNEDVTRLFDDLLTTAAN